MCKKMIFFIFAMLFSMQTFAIEYLDFPAEIGGLSKLKGWLARKNNSLKTVTQTIKYDKDSLVFVVYNSVGYGLVIYDVYIYACTDVSCSLVALRRGVNIPRRGGKLNAEFSSNRDELLLVSGDDKEVFLRVPIIKTKY